MRKVDDELISLLPVGADDPITASELCKLLDLPSVREVTKLINLIRRRGTVICSNGRGYFRPADKCDIQSFVRQMRSRMKEIKLAALSAEQALQDTTQEEGDEDERP